MDADGRPIARRIVRSFAGLCAGDVVFAVELEPGVAANPFFEFTFQVEASATLSFVWVEDDGAVTTAERRIERD